MTFSWAQAKKDAVDIKIRRAKIMLRTNKDYKLKHVAEARDANTGNYTQLTKRIKEETEKAQMKTETMTRKLHEQ